MIGELDIVALVHDLPEHGLKAGDIGTVVLLHDDQGYEVEFTTFGGDTIAIVTVRKDEVRPMRGDEIHHARPLHTTA
jgi:hypothetical protein